VKIKVVVFCIMTPCSDVVGCQHFSGPYCLTLHDEVNAAVQRSID